MSKEAERVYLTRKMETQIGQFGFPISLPNQPFNIPKNSAYGEFHIIAGPKPVIVSGEGTAKVRVRRVGMVQLTIYIPKEKGTKIAAVASDKFEEIFQLRKGRDTSMSTYKFGIMQDYTPETKAGWECYVYRVPFEKDSIEVAHIGME